MPIVTRKRKAAMEAEAASQPKRLPMRSKDEEAPTKITFDDQGNPDQAMPVAPSISAAPPQDDGDSDSDEAPEAVSTTKAASEVKQSTQAAQRAALESAATEKKKRQARDALFKQQAAERREAQLKKNTRRRGPLEVPALLPDEFLTDESDDEEQNDAPTQERQTIGAVRNVRYFEDVLVKEGRGPRDQVRGTTLYRVSRAMDERLAPKMRKSSANFKQALLRRGRKPVKGPSAGFFK